MSSDIGILLISNTYFFIIKAEVDMNEVTNAKNWLLASVAGGLLAVLLLYTLVPEKISRRCLVYSFAWFGAYIHTSYSFAPL